MSFADLLIHTCTIRRATITQDAYNNDRAAFNNWAVGVRCRLMIDNQQVRDAEGAQHPTITTYTLLLGASEDIQDGDQIADIAHPDDTVPGETFTVESIAPIQGGGGIHHYEVSLQRVN